MDVNRDPLAPFQAGQTQGSSGLEVTYLMDLHLQQIVTLSGFIVCSLTKPRCYFLQNYITVMARCLQQQVKVVQMHL